MKSSLKHYDSDNYRCPPGSDNHIASPSASAAPSFHETASPSASAALKISRCRRCPRFRCLALSHHWLRGVKRKKFLCTCVSHSVALLLLKGIQYYIIHIVFISPPLPSFLLSFYQDKRISGTRKDDDDDDQIWFKKRREEWSENR